MSLIDNVQPGHESYQNEIFGPVLEVMRVGTYEDAVKLVNDNQYGNGTAIFTRGKVVTARWPDPGTSKVDLGFPHTR